MQVASHMQGNMWRMVFNMIKNSPKTIFCHKRSVLLFLNKHLKKNKSVLQLTPGQSSPPNTHNNLEHVTLLLICVEIVLCSFHVLHFTRNITCYESTNIFCLNILLNLILFYGLVCRFCSWNMHEDRPLGPHTHARILVFMFACDKWAQWAGWHQCNIWLYVKYSYQIKHVSNVITINELRD